MKSPSLTTRLRRLLRPQPRVADTFYEEILYLFARTQSLEDLLTVLPERVCAALELASFHILLRHGSEYVLQISSKSANQARVTFPASCSTVSRMRRDAKPALFFPKEAAGTDTDGWQWLAEPYELEALTHLEAQLLLPLAGRTGLIGFATLSRHHRPDTRHPFSPAELRFLRDLGPEMGRGLETAQLVTSISHAAVERAQAHHELEVAREVQHRLLPGKLPPVPGLDIAAAYRSAAEIGGDYYDLIPTPSGSFCAVIADISGKGVPAALLMAALRASLHALLLEPPQPVTELIARLNTLLYRASSSSRYATLFLCLYDPETRRLTCVNAGHNPPVLLCADGSHRRLTCGGTVIGLLPQATYDAEIFELHPGDTLVAYTDGITEADNQAGDEWGDQGLMLALNSRAPDARTIVSSILSALDRHVGTAPQRDDLTLLVLRNHADRQT